MGLWKSAVVQGVVRGDGFPSEIGLSAWPVSRHFEFKAVHGCIILGAMLLLCIGLFFVQLQNYNAIVSIAEEQDTLIDQQMQEIFELSQGRPELKAPVY